MKTLLLASLLAFLALCQTSDSLLRKSSALIAPPSQVKLYGVDLLGNTFPVRLGKSVKVTFVGNEASVEATPCSSNLVPCNIWWRAPGCCEKSGEVKDCPAYYELKPPSN
jgi:hypothetical protein